MLGIDLLTIAGCRVGLGLGVYAVEVEQFVVVAWIHDNSAVCAIPNHQGVSSLYKRPRDWIIQGGLSWDQEAESSLSGAK